MMKFYDSNQLLKRALPLTASAILSFVVAQAQCVAPSVGCSGNDRANSFINSSTPNTIEYDNVVSLFHSTFARQADGRVLVWGEKIGSGGANILSPQEINASNYSGLSGEILKFAGGSQINTNSQHFVLTTNGLYFWGTDHWGIGTGTSFQKLTIDGVANGLPAGVNPADVKMLFGTHRMLGLVTCSGEAYTLVAATNAATSAAYGDGTTTYNAVNNKVWHRVKTSAAADLTDVVALRGNGQQNFMALTSTGMVYTWGSGTYLGDASASTTRVYATSMDLPAGISPKMIGMNTGGTAATSSYYLLATNGNLYALGNNAQRQLGNFGTGTETSWVQVQKSATAGDYLTDVVWFSPNEHDFGGTYAAVNAITADTALYAWGSNSRQMLGGSAANINPSTNVGSMTATDKVMAVETGGHTTMVLKKCSSFFGYVGHKTGGSMADGSATDADIPNYSFSTSQLDMCGASTLAATLFPIANAKAGQTYQMIAAPAGGTYSLVRGAGTIDPSTGLLTITGAGTVEVKYDLSSGACPSQSTVTFIADIALPIKLVSFTAERKNNDVVLDWATTNEVNNKGFEVLHSANGSDWKTMSFVGSKAPDGNSTAQLNYQYTATQPVNGKNYYRLKQLDRDGRYEYSVIKQIHFDAEKQIELYPNPVEDNLKVTGLSEHDIIKVRDAYGRTIQEIKANASTINIPFKNLSKGIYYVEVYTEHGHKIYEKVVKQ
ncbi:hypothetical protein DBR32_14885 [Taibaiella sp. KBW10]|uniref:T9SS type A sorting domain-containing protein n=1 Tax=Taibaiella sp. KBW10 TaxID=2153357 RepID=UPI000F59E15C|nr:T9SS type A sorting domain-containing protein [Taibaiella sp. KBW10]RQO29862.1 hypothetical protein DBR32_14885 [Taibaiella sp. KBW10]